MKCNFYCVNTSYPMDNMLNRSAQTGPPNVRKRRPVFPPAGRSSHCTRQVACRTSFLSRQADVIASFSFGACTAWTNIENSFYPTALKGCRGIVFTHGVRMGGRASGRAGGRREIVCPGCISETVRCRKLILGRDIG